MRGIRHFTQYAQRRRPLPSQALQQNPRRDLLIIPSIPDFESDLALGLSKFGPRYYKTHTRIRCLLPAVASPGLSSPLLLGQPVFDQRPLRQSRIELRIIFCDPCCLSCYVKPFYLSHYLMTLLPCLISGTGNRVYLRRQ